MNCSAPTSTLRLTIRGRGHVPSFKNNKMLARGKLITHPKKQQWMEQAIHDLESQLRSLCQTSDGATSMGLVARSLIAWSQRFDDSVQWVDQLHILAVELPKGEEGANIDIYFT